jgi:hypothetical protein
MMVLNMKTKTSAGGRILALVLVGCGLMRCAAEPVSLAGQISPATASPAREIILQDDQTSIAFDADSGALIRLTNQTAHWTLERRPELGVSFRLFAPLPERRWNPVLGQKQRAAEIKKVSANELHIRWENLISESSVEKLPITVDAAVTLTNGGLTFRANVKNDSALTVETVDYPYFGDFNPVERGASLQVRVMMTNQPAHLKMDEIYPHFGNEKGYWGVFWPSKMREAQQSRFCLISSTNAGV